MKTIKLFLIIIFIYFVSCKSNNKNIDYLLTINSLNFNRLVEWDGLKTKYITLSIKIKNESNDVLMINNDIFLDSLFFELNYKKKKKKLTIINEDTIKTTLKTNDSIIIDLMIRDYMKYGDNLQEMLDNNIDLVKSNYFILSKNLFVNKDRVKVDTFFKSKKTILNMYLDNEKVKLTDKKKMNYYYEVPLAPAQ